MKKKIIRYFSILITIIAIYGIWIAIEKKISFFIKNEIVLRFKTELNWTAEIDEVKVSLTPPSLMIKELQLETQLPYLEKLALKEAEIRLDFLSLLGGKVEISRIRSLGLYLPINFDQLPESKDPITTINTDILFSTLKQFPIRTIFFEDSFISLTSDKYINFNLKNLNLLLQYDGQSISTILSSNSNISKNEAQTTPLKLKLRSVLSKREFRIEELVAQTPFTSSLVFTGKTTNLKNILIDPTGEFFYSMNFDFSEWKDLIKNLNFYLPDLTGQIMIKGSGKWSDKKNQRIINSEAQFKNLNLESFNLGNIFLNFIWKDNIATSDKILFSHPAGNITLKHVQLETQENFNIKANVDLKSMDLQNLFIALKLKNIPVELGVDSQLECKGELKIFNLRCEGQVKGTELIVNSGQTKNSVNIVHVDEFSGKGWVNVNSEEVSYDSTIELHESKGTTQGVINYKTGFSISYQSDELNLEHIKNLANLKFKGKTQINGKTEGDSSAATIDMFLSTSNFWFENFGLGNIEAPLQYKKGILSIKTDKANLQDTQYVGLIDINLNNNTLKGHFESPLLEASDVIYSLTEKVKIPVEISGRGNAIIDFEGPFALGQMTYNLQGQLLKGSIANESFDEINFDIKSEEGHVKIINNHLRKNKSLLQVDGSATPKGIINLQFVGRGFNLEESFWVSKYFPSLTGNYNFEMNLNNHILNPDIEFKSKITNSILGDIELPDSTLQFEANNDEFLSQIDLLGHQIVSEIKIPFSKNNLAKFYLEIQKFNFTELIGLSTENPINSEYKSEVTLKLDLNSETSSLLDSSGSLIIESLNMSRNNDYFRQDKPLIMNFSKGNAKFENYTLSGPDTFLTFKSKDFSLRRMDIILTGKLNLKVTQLFLPFFEDFGGFARGDLRIAGSLLSPEIYGDINVQDAFLKFQGFPHALEKLSTRIEFIQNKLSLNSIRGHLAGGLVLGDGKIEWKGGKNLPISIRGQIQDVNLNVPDKIKTLGSGEINFEGSWVPYNITGIYRVKQGLIEKEFSDTGSHQGLSSGVKSSSYLPKNIQVQQMAPINLDLQVVIDQNLEIKNSQIKGNLVGQFQVKGPPTNPNLNGMIKLQPGTQLLVKDKQFEVLSGLIKFNDPNEINPDLYISGRTRIDPYDINLMIQGKSQKPQILLSSQPPLEDRDLISLLALGVTSQKLDQDIQSDQQAAQTGYQLGTAIISANPLNKEIKESLGVDVKFTSDFDDTKNVAVPKVTVAKEIVPKKLNVSASSSMNDIQVYDVRLKYILNEKLSAVGTYQDSNSISTSNSSNAGSPERTSIFGLDLEYKVEFK